VPESDWRDDVSEETTPRTRIAAIHVGWQQRYIDPDEGPTIWQFCCDRDAKILKGREDYELRPVYVLEAQP
jgi:hypothetical protein